MSTVKLVPECRRHYVWGPNHFTLRIPTKDILIDFIDVRNNFINSFTLTVAHSSDILMGGSTYR